jgi:hypothetical protein
MNHQSVCEVLKKVDVSKQPIYQRICNDLHYHNTAGFHVLDDGTLCEGYFSPSEYMNFNSREEAQVYLNPRPVILQVLTGATYRSISEAAHRNNISAVSVSSAMRSGKPVKGHWYIDPSNPPATLHPPIDQRQAAVHCIDTGASYTSMTEAAIDHKLDLPALSRAIRFGLPIKSRVMDKKVTFVRV